MMFLKSSLICNIWGCLMPVVANSGCRFYAADNTLIVVGGLCIKPVYEDL